MERIDLAKILFSLPSDGSLKEVSNIKFPDAHVQQLVKQGYIQIIEIETIDMVTINLTRLGVEWVKHHCEIARVSNILI